VFGRHARARKKIYLASGCACKKKKTKIKIIATPDLQGLLMNNRGRKRKWDATQEYMLDTDPDISTCTLYSAEYHLIFTTRRRVVIIRLLTTVFRS